jgi:tetratricopeptide (TPR) repeat protein
MSSSGVARMLVLVGCVSGSVFGAAASAMAQGTADAYFEFLMARRLEAQGDHTGAQAALERATRASNRSAEIWAELSAFHLRRSQPEEAERAAKAGLAIDDNNLEAHRALGLVYAGYADAASPRTPQSPEIETFQRDGILHLEKAATGPTSANDLLLNYTLGRLYLRAGAPEKAILSLNRTLAQNPGSVQTRLALAQAHAAANDLTGAIESLALIVDDEPRVAAVLAQYQERAGLLIDAAVTYSKALAVQPMSRELKFRRIAVLFEAKDFGRAAAFAADARKQHPEDARFPRLHARAAFDGGDRSGGLAILEGAARTFPRDVPTQYALADMYSDAGRAPEAERALRAVLTIEPANANALNYLGYMLAKRGEQLDEAVDLVRRALVAEPDNGAFLDSLGWAYFRKGDLGEAEKHLNAAAERLPKNSEVQDHLGDVYARRARWQDAITAWTRALDGDGSDTDKAVVQRKINDARARLRR